MSRLAVFDIDGVIADERHRTPYALSRNWGLYFHPLNLVQDRVWPQGRDAYERELYAGNDIVCLTGRGEMIRDTTAEWLARHGFEHKALIMRKEQHQTRNGWPLARLKTEILNELSIIYDGKVTVYDDDPEVCRQVSRTLPWIDVRHCTWHVKPSPLVRRGQA